MLKYWLLTRFSPLSMHRLEDEHRSRKHLPAGLGGRTSSLSLSTTHLQPAESASSSTQVHMAGLVVPIRAFMSPSSITCRAMGSEQRSAGHRRRAASSVGPIVFRGFWVACPQGDAQLHIHRDDPWPERTVPAAIRGRLAHSTSRPAQGMQ